MINIGMHKQIVVIFLSLVFIFYTARSQRILSLNPLFTEQTATLMLEVENEWSSSGICFPRQ